MNASVHHERLRRAAAVLAATALLVAAASGVAPARATDVVASPDLARSCPQALDVGRFPDVTSGPHQRAVGCVASWGVTTGYADGSFGASGNISRAQFATFLDRLVDHAGRRPARAPNLFDDVPATASHASAINAMAAAGVIPGMSTTRFAPGDAVTRGAFAASLAAVHTELLDLAFTSSAGDFRDVKGGPQKAAIGHLVAAGVISGYPDGTFRPDTPITRAQMATLLTRYLDVLVGLDLVDVPLPPALSDTKLCSYMTRATFDTWWGAFFNRDWDDAEPSVATVSGHDEGASCRITQAGSEGVSLELTQVSRATYEARKAIALATKLPETPSGGRQLSYPADSYWLPGSTAAGPNEGGYAYRGLFVRVVHRDDALVNNVGVHAPIEVVNFLYCRQGGTSYQQWLLGHDWCEEGRFNP